jgi:small subunit ribosomal protein S6
MRKYELLLILPAEADDAVVNGVTDRVSGVIGRSGGEISKLDRWGRRRFAYEIDHATEGYYLLAELIADPSDVKELDRVLVLADEVIRFKIVVLPERRGRGRGRPAAAGSRDEAQVAPAPAPEPVSAPASSAVATEEPVSEEPAGAMPAATGEEELAGADEDVAPVVTAATGDET